MVALELMVNCAYLEAALSGAPLEELHRSLFDRELNELALLLGPPDFRVASIPYIKWSAWESRMSRIRLRPVASYEPDEPALLEEVLTDMRAASDVVAAKVWTAREREAMAHLNEPHHPHVH